MDTTIINNKFEEWTKGLNDREARISIFRHIRDIPYAIIPKLRDPEVGPSGILELNEGSCQPKHFLLAMLFAKLNIPVKYVTYPFKWGEQPLKYNNDLQQIVGSIPKAYHLACKAYLENKWVLVDATHDPALKKYGFPVNEGWDGASNTKNAVITMEEVIHDSLKERIDFESAQRSLYTEEEKARYAAFVEKFNLWLKEIRKE